MWFRRKSLICCPVCESQEINVRTLPYPQIDGLTFDTTGTKSTVSECLVCGHIWKPIADQEAEAMESRFEDPEYSDSRIASSILIGVDGRPQDLIGVQADMLAGQFPLHNPNILDIGCGNGELLAELKRRTTAKNAYFCGYDVAQRNMVDPTLIFCMDLGAFEPSSFDLIILSHSLQYAYRIDILMQHIKRLSHANTTLYIQVPDLTRNPCSLLTAEQLHFFNIENLSSLLGRYDFWEVDEQPVAFPRDLCVFAWRGANNFTENETPINRLDSHVQQIQKMAGWLHIYDRRENLCILGSTIMAAFAHHCMGDKIKNFVDENPLRLEQGFFRGKPVIAPDNLTDKGMLLIPMFGARRLQLRMAKQYQARVEAYESMDPVGIRSLQTIHSEGMTI